MTDKKEMKIEFAPGCFDSFEGSQEELDALVKQIQDMFNNATPEEIEAMSRPMSEEDFELLPDEIKEQLESFDEYANIELPQNRNLQ